MKRRFSILRPGTTWAVLLLAAACAAPPQSRISVLTDEQFQRLSLDLSEAPGYFDTDNLISNETSYQQVIPRLQDLEEGGAYLGVGPDQNFTYIAAVRPRIAVIIDIRRDNLLQHLYFKQLFRMAETPVDYLALLLAKAPPDSPSLQDPDRDFPALLQAFESAPTEGARFGEVFERVWSGLRGSFPLLVQPSDRARIESMARSFHEEGLDLRFTSHGRPPRAIYPTLRRLLLETDGGGRRHNYLSSPALYRTVREMQLENRVVPVVGDLGGEKALRAIGDYLRERNCPVSAFYTSNVEFYLFSNGTFDRYASNVARLPVGPGALFVRSYFNYWREPHPHAAPGYPMASLLQPIEAFLAVEAATPFRDYQQLVRLHSLPLSRR